MPKKVIDYSKSVIYKIVSKDLDVTDLYVGSTTELVKRKCKHKCSCNNDKDAQYNLSVYKFIRENGGWDNWDIILIEIYPCTNKFELLSRERYYIELLNAKLNHNIPLQTEKEYWNRHKDKMREKNKRNRENHKNEKKERDRQYYILNKDKIKDYQERNKENINEKARIRYQKLKLQKNQNEEKDNDPENLNIPTKRLI